MTILRGVKRIIILLLVLLFQVGCMDNGPVNSNKTIGAASNNSNTGHDEKTRLQYAQWAVPLTTTVEEAIQEYNKTNTDNIQVDYLKIPRTSYNNILNMLLASGEGPDVFEAQSEWLFSYTYKNWLYNLAGAIDGTFLARFPLWARNLAEDDKFRNYFYSIPSGQATFRLIYNKDLFIKAGLDPEKPPETFNDLTAYAKKITEIGRGDRKYGFALAANDIWNGFAYPMEAVSSYSGAYYFNFKSGKYDLNVYQPLLSAFIKMKDEGSLFPGETTMKEDLALIQFAEGNIGMMFAESWEPILLKDLFPTKCDWAVAMPPVVDSSDRKGHVGIGTLGWQVINNKTKNPDKAVLFWKYLYSLEYNSELFKNGCLLPVVNGIMDNPAYKPNIPNLNKFMPGMWDAVSQATPLDIDECGRANVYISIFNKSLPLEIGLNNESYRLNMLLEMNNINGRVNLNNYIGVD